MTSSSIARLAKRIARVERLLFHQSTQPQLANSSIENGAIEEYDANDSLVQRIGRQHDGTHTSAQFNGSPPPTPSAPLVSVVPGGATVEWDGTFADGGIAPMNFTRVDIHVSSDPNAHSTDPLDRATLVASANTARGGSTFIPLPTVEHYAWLVAWNGAGRYSTASAEVAFTAQEIAPPPTDGTSPASSPAATVIDGIGVIFAGWQPVTNADPVTYSVHALPASALADPAVPDFTPTDTPTLTATNLVPAPSFETGSDMTTWTKVGLSITEGDTSWQTDGAACGRVSVVTASGSQYIYAQDAGAGNRLGAGVLTTGQYVSARIAVRAEVDIRVQLSLYGYGAGDAFVATIANTANIDLLAGEETVLELNSALASAAGITSFLPILWFRERGTGATPVPYAVGTDIAKIDAAACYVTDAPTGWASVPYIDGDTAAVPGVAQHAWTGTPHGSTSTQTQPATKVAETESTQVTIRALSDDTPLSYNEEYAVRVVASDADGAAAPGAGALGGPRQVDVEDVSANYGYFGAISVDQLTGGTFSAEAVISGAFKTAVGGQRVEIGSFGIRVYNSAGDLRTIIAPDQTMFRGDAEVDHLTSMLSAAFRGDVEFSRGSVTTFEAGVTRPSTPPTAEVGHLRVPFTGGEVLWGPDAPNNLQWDPVNSRWLMVGRYSGNSYMYAFDSAGVYQNTYWHVDDSGSFWDGTAVMLGANYDQVLTVRGHGSGGGNDQYKVWLGGASAAGGVQIGTIPRFQRDVMPAVVRVGADEFAVVERGDSAMVSASFAGTIIVREFQVWNNSSVVLLSTMKYGQGWGTKTRVTGYYEGMADFGGDRVLFGLDRESTGFFQYRPFLTDGSGANDNNNDFPYPSPFVPWHLGGTKACGLAWDGSNFWTLGLDKALYKHEANKGDTSVSALEDTWWAAHTWHTSPGGAETDVGEARSFTMPRRSRVTITTAQPNDTGEPGDPNGIGVYLARQATTPARTDLWLQGLQAGNIRVVETPVLTGTNPPAANGYTDSTPAIARSRKLDSGGVKRVWELSGAGPAKVGPLTVDANGNGSLRPMLQSGKVTITGFSSGSPDTAITKAVTFPTPFVGVPNVSVGLVNAGAPHNLGYPPSALNVTATGFTAVASRKSGQADVEVGWVAHYDPGVT